MTQLPSNIVKKRVFVQETVKVYEESKCDAGDSAELNTRCRPFHGLDARIYYLILGLAPQALCCHLLRRFRAQ